MQKGILSITAYKLDLKSLLDIYIYRKLQYIAWHVPFLDHIQRKLWNYDPFQMMKKQRYNYSEETKVKLVESNRYTLIQILQFDSYLFLWVFHMAKIFLRMALYTNN